MERSHKKCLEEHRAGRRVAVAAGMPKPAGERFFAPTTSGRDDKHGRGMPSPLREITLHTSSFCGLKPQTTFSFTLPTSCITTMGDHKGRPYISRRVRLLVLADKTNNNALLTLVPIKSDSDSIARILTAPRSDYLLPSQNKGLCFVIA